MVCNIDDYFLDSNFTKEETIRYFGLDFWYLMNESCGNYDLTLSAVAFISQIIGEGENRVCDLMCGNGRHAIALDSLGYDVTAIDVRTDIINNIRSNNCRNKVKWICADVYNEPLSLKYDTITILTSSLGYYGKEDDKKFLSKCFESLKDGGKLIIDSPNGDVILSKFIKKDWMRIKDKYYLFKYSLLGQTKYTSMTVIDGSDKREYFMKMYIYMNDEMISMLEEVGFSSVNTYGDFGFNTLTDVNGHKRIQYVAQKR